MTVWNRRTTSLSTLGSSSQARHFGRGTGLINEDKMFRVQVRLRVEPRLPPLGDVGPLLLAGVRGFF